MLVKIHGIGNLKIQMGMVNSMENAKIIYSNEKEFLDRKFKIEKNFLINFSERIDDFFSSSGRIELLGNHTDHNNGKVLVSAVSLDIFAGVKKTNDNYIRIVSEGFPLMTININNLSLSPNEKGKSSAMVKGVVQGFLNRGLKVGGFICYATSNIYKGAGVSSSAAYELLICEILNYYYNEDKVDRVEMAKIAQYSEVEFFGKPCGLLDQMGISLGGVNMIDFESTKTPLIQHVELELKDYDVVLINTGDDHSALTPYYAEIKDDMAKIAKHFKKNVLREVTHEDFLNEIPTLRKKFGGRAIIRAMHYYDENKRVEKAYKAICNKDISTFLNCVNESGESSYKMLQNCYYANDASQGITLALTISKKIIKDGACRVHGGGFAGTILAFVNKNESDYYLDVMRKVFGDENCNRVNLRMLGSIKI